MSSQIHIAHQEKRASEMGDLYVNFLQIIKFQMKTHFGVKYRTHT